MRTRVTIVQDPHPALRAVCDPITDFNSSYLSWLVASMRSAIDESPVVALGLAANQIGETKRVIIVVQGGQQIVMVNPVIKLQNGVQTVKDGCLSVQGGTYFRSRTRPRFLTVDYRDTQGAEHRRRANGIHAAAIAHEIDHLNGILFIDEPKEAA